MAKVLIIAGYASSLYIFRGPLIRTLKEKHQVSTTAPFDSNEVSEKVKSLGVDYYPNSFQRAGMNPLADLKASNELRKIIEMVAPDYVLAYTIKPVIFGLSAAMKAGVKNTYALITGLGSGFDQNSFKQRLLYLLIKRLYRNSLKRSSGVIFQNPDDRKFFLDHEIIRKDQNTEVVNGSGVDLDYFYPSSPKTSQISFLLVARMVREKGVVQFVNVARRVKLNFPETTFELLGWVDENPNSLSRDDIRNWEDEGVITYHGAVNDVRPFIANSSVFVLPTYYREGTPRTILEAMSMQKPIITTNTPGCKETVVNGMNGFLVAPKDEKELYDKVVYFINNPKEIDRMGKESLRIARQKYDVAKVNAQLIEFMGLE